ncbi:MAG TPA: four helix bundle protein [Terracidiphilus sp.]|nr:four helix bundle protein [Terracidiphilus sp.]
MAVRTFRDLLVWQRAIQLATAVYRLTSAFPKEEIYGLTGQMRRAAVSAGSNIAEGQGRLTTGEFRHFLGMARGSNLELQTQIEVARALKFGDAGLLKEVEELSFEVGKMINGLLAKTKS